MTRDDYVVLFAVIGIVSVSVGVYLSYGLGNALIAFGAFMYLMASAGASE